MKVLAWDLVESVSNTMDMLNSNLSEHHSKTAYIATSIAKALGKSNYDIERIAYAALLHDCGVFSLAEGNMLLEFDFDDEEDRHSLAGAKLLKGMFEFDLSEIVRFHHVNWQDGAGADFNGTQIPIESHIIHLADRVAVLTPGDTSIITKKRSIVDAVNVKSGFHFHPELIKVLTDISGKDSFWLDIIDKNINETIRELIPVTSVTLNVDKLKAFSKAISNLIDYKSRFTACHSIGNAQVAYVLGLKCGFSESQCSLLEIAGLLHDLGKLAIPSEILEKNGSLDENEFAIMRSHSYMTYSALKRVKGMENIVLWASEHHEKLDGTGYPFCKQGADLSLESRILAVADIYTALSEDRPYREGMKKEDVIKILNSMSNLHVDSSIVTVLVDSYEEINDIRLESQRTAFQHYEQNFSSIAGTA